MEKNNKLVKYLCWFFIVTIVIVSFVALSYNPMKRMDLIPREDDIVLELGLQNIEWTNSCEIDSDGNVSITGYDAYIVFNEISNEEKSIVLELEEISDKDISAQIYVDYGNGYNENDSFLATCNKGCKYICFSIRPEKYIGFRIDIDTNYSFYNVSIHKNDPELVVIPNNLKLWRVLFALVASVLVIISLVIIDRKINYVDKIAKFIIDNSKRIIRIVVASFVFILLMVILPVNKSLLIFGYALFMVFLSFVINFKNLKEKTEIVFGEILFVSGVTMILLQPYGLTCWDNDSHYRWAIEASSFDDVMITNEEAKILSNNMEFVSLMNNGTENAHKINAAKINGQYATGKIKNGFSLPHCMNGLAIAILRLFNVDFYWRFVLGKLPTLLIYTLLCYLAMRRLKSGKMILATIALFPTSLLIATNYTYDYWVTGFSLLGMAYFVGNCQEKDEYISAKDTLIIAISMAMACIPKLIYIGLMLVPFFMPKKKIDNRKKYYLINILVMACLFIMLFVKSLLLTTGTGDLRGGSDVNPSGQIMFILSDIFRYAVILINFLKQYLSISGMQGYITHFAYLGMASGYIVFVVVLVLATVFDKDECDVGVYPILSRAYVVVMYFGEAVLIATALYVIFTGVGADTVLGCQPRYIVPLLYPMLSIICGRGINLKINKYMFNGILLAICTSVLFYDIYNMMLIRVM